MDLLYEQTFPDISCLWRRENAYFFLLLLLLLPTPLPPRETGAEREGKGEKVRVIAMEVVPFLFLREI